MRASALLLVLRMRAALIERKIRALRLVEAEAAEPTPHYMPKAAG